MSFFLLTISHLFISIGESCPNVKILFSRNHASEPALVQPVHFGRSQFQTLRHSLFEPASQSGHYSRSSGRGNVTGGKSQKSDSPIDQIWQACGSSVVDDLHSHR